MQSQENDDEYANYTDEEEDYTYEEDEEEQEEVENNVEETPQKDGTDNDTSSTSINQLITSDLSLVSCQDVFPVMETLVEDVSILLDLSADCTTTLLQHFHWDKEKLINQFFSDPSKTIIDAGIENLKKLSENFENTTNDIDNGKKQEFFTCRICYDDQCDANDTFSLGCKHTFCRDCFSEYLRNQVQDGPTCVIACCPEHKCTERVTRDVFTQLLRAEDLERYNVYLIRNFIETCKSMRYCPAPGCDKVAMGTGLTTVVCSCSNPFCFRCGDEGHEPSSCEQLQLWREKCMNESETANWILVNTKKCPACQTRIEKNQGCNHMTCRICKHDFCWICMGDWKAHGSGTGAYNCNRYEAKGNENTKNAKEELERYLHYFTRFQGHDVALKFAATHRETTEQRIVSHQENQEFSFIDVQFFNKAVQQVIACRRILKYSYILGYYLKPGSTEKQLFEHHQEMLEKNAERLHEYTEMPIEKIEFTQMENLTRATGKFLTSLMAGMTNGVILDELKPLVQLN